MEILSPNQEMTELVRQQLKQYKTTPTLLADALRTAILRGILKGGQTLRQEELAASFGVSRMPLREAFRQLEAEGLLTIYPHKGAVVTELSAQEVEELYEIRLALETTALTKAIPNLTSQHFERAENLLAQADEGSDIGRWGELNWQFHATLYEAANRPRLLAMLERVHHSVDRYMRLELATLDYQAHSQAEHQILLAACREQEIERAVGILQEHIESAGKLLVAFLENAKAVS
jgi:DNA-binding GntR family transcriptional regulator